MFKPRIHSICNCGVHLFPVRMRYRGERRRGGWWVHVMRCPVCGREKHYVYLRGRIIKRVA